MLLFHLENTTTHLLLVVLTALVRFIDEHLADVHYFERTLVFIVFRAIS